MRRFTKIDWLKILVFWNKVKIPLMVGAFIGLFVANFVVLQRITDANREADERAKQAREQIEGLIRETNEHLDCIAEYFTRINRSGLFLKDLDDCRYERKTSSVNTSKPLASDPPPKSPTTVRRPPTPVARRASSPPPPPSTTRQVDRSFLDVLPKELNWVEKQLDNLGLLK